MFVLKRTVEFNDLVTSTLFILRIKKCANERIDIYFVRLIFKAYLCAKLTQLYLQCTCYKPLLTQKITCTIDPKNLSTCQICKSWYITWIHKS